MEINFIRHFVKGIRNKIVKASKLVRCSILGDWLNTIVNMLWWSLATAKGRVPEMTNDKHYKDGGKRIWVTKCCWIPHFNPLS